MLKNEAVWFLGVTGEDGLISPRSSPWLCNEVIQENQLRWFATGESKARWWRPWSISRVHCRFQLISLMPQKVDWLECGGNIERGQEWKQRGELGTVEWMQRMNNWVRVWLQNCFCLDSHEKWFLRSLHQENKQYLTFIEFISMWQELFGLFPGITFLNLFDNPVFKDLLFSSFYR